MGVSNIIKSVYRKIFPARLREIIFTFRAKIRCILNLDNSYGEKVSFGKQNPNKTFYVIRTQADKWGALTTWIMLMPHVAFAFRKGYIPIFDLKNTINLAGILDSENVGKINAWDLYFNQPQYNYSLDEIMQSKKVILANQGIPEFEWKKNILNANLPLCEEDFNFWRQMYEYCPFSDDIIKYAEGIKNKLFPKDEKVLAVSYRRSFEWHHYVKSDFVPAGSHLIRGTLDFILQEIDSRLRESNYEYFFFTSDDRESYTVVKEKFGKRCLYTERPLCHFFKNGKPISIEEDSSMFVEFNKRKNDVYIRAKEYLADVYLISQCDSFLSCGSSADFMAYIINNKKYEHFVQIKGEGDTKTHASDSEKK